MDVSQATQDTTSAMDVSLGKSSHSRVTFCGDSEPMANSRLMEDSIGEQEFLQQEEGRVRRRSKTLRRMDSSSFGASRHLRMSRKAEDLDVDEDILHRAAADAGLGSLGTVYVEVWCLTEDGTELVRPEGGYWMDPIFHNPDTGNGCCGSMKCCACRISNPDHPKFIPADPVAPGVGLAGVLWSESNSVEDTANNIGTVKDSITSGGPRRGSGGPNMTQQTSRRSLFGASSGSGRSGYFRSSTSAFFGTSTRNTNTHQNGSSSSKKKKVIWRDVQAMSNNPHLPFDERLHAIAESGLGWAAGVPFNVNHHKGIVIYVARNTVDHDLLQEPGNENYMLCAANLIGSAWALREPRRQAMESRKAKRDAALRRAKLKIITLVRMGAKFDHAPCKVEDLSMNVENSKGSKPKVLRDESDSRFEVIKERAQQVYKAVATVVKKCKGSNNKPPPPFNTDQAIFTFLGSFCLLALLSGISHSMVTNHGPDFLLLMPPFGAFVCLQFGLTQAPAAQPRNCLIGQTLSIFIALTVSILPFLPIWLKQALATSMAIGVMTRCGVTHPPAGASAFLFASGQFGITHFLLLLGGNMIAILVGSVLNNTSEKRQYPTYYAMGLNPKDMIEYLNQ